MRKQNLIAGAALSVLISLTSCGGSSPSDSLLFGKVPAIVEAFNAERDKLKEELKQSSDGEAITQKFEALKSETFSKAEEAGKAWSGTTLALSSDDQFTVNTPITVSFDGFRSQIDMTVKYALTGEIAVAKDYLLNLEQSKVDFLKERGCKGAMFHVPVEIVGLDADGNEVTRDKIGYVHYECIGDKAGIPAGSVVELESLSMLKKQVAEYAKVKTLKLGIKE